MSVDEAVNIIKDSVAIAFRARSKYLEETRSKTGRQGCPLVAGSVGPYGACLHDRSEYTGSYVDHVSRDAMKAWHRPRMAALLEAGVHLLACETIPALVRHCTSGVLEHKWQASLIIYRMCSTLY